MGFFDDLVDAVEDVGEAVVGAAEVVVDTVTNVGGAVAGAVVDTGGAIFDFGSDLASPIWGLAGGVVEVIQDPMAAAQALGDIITDPVGAVEGAFGAAMDYGLGLGSDVVDIFGSAGSGVYGVGSAVVESGLDAVGSAGGIIGDAVGGAAGLANAALGGYGDDVLDLVDDYVLDTVDSVTLGVIDVDFDNGELTTSVGVDGLLEFETGLSGDGVTVGADVPLIGAEVGLTGDDGATLLFDENVPGVELPAGARVGVGIDDQGDTGVIAVVDDLGITVGIAGDYDSDITLDQIQALSGGGSARVAAPENTGIVPPDITGIDTTAPDSFDTGFEAPAPEPEPLTDFAQDIVEVEQVETSADDVWDDL
ncbi:MAG: hypothetical protein Q8M22_15075 [Actinomycetota bacterium]|nr:hypothetical protein [Actinomycetota bacterium]